MKRQKQIEADRSRSIFRGSDRSEAKTEIEAEIEAEQRQRQRQPDINIVLSLTLAPILLPEGNNTLEPTT